MFHRDTTYTYNLTMQHYSVWTILRVFNISKRRVPVIFVTFGIIGLLLRWRLICLNIQPKLHINNVCTSFTNGQALGNLCQNLCHKTETRKVSCQTFHMEKESVFTGVWMNDSVIYKTIKTGINELSNNMDFSKDMLILEKEFITLIKVMVRMKFNVAINDIDAKRMSYIHYSQPGGNRYTEMQNVWSLIQDNEYLALYLYEKFNVFPKLVGTCGPLYAVQKLDSISGYWHLMTLYDSQKEWEKRVKISLMILDFLQLLETLPEPMLICDVKMNHFGVTNDFKKIKYLDLDAVHPLSIANSLTATGSPCKHHSDCDLKDCRSFCNLITHKCQHGVVNNNLQIVCERIFLGWVTGRIMVPGLLFGPKAPTVLIEVLERCANPSNEDGVPRSPASKEIRTRLYTLLKHIIM